ncbi:MAG: efflux RND transporter periplasmic adaptor subunit [bacterium]
MAAETITVEAITRRRKRRFFKGWLIWPLLIVALAAGGYWYWTKGQTVAATVHYTTKEVATGNITVIVTAVGTVEPIEQVDVGSLISGTIAEVGVKVNDQVTKGQVLARLDTSSLEADLSRVQALLAASKAQVQDATVTRTAAIQTLDRAQKIRERGLNSVEDLSTAATAKLRADAALVSAEANVQVAEANVKLSQTSLDKAVIVAPIDGMVLDVAADLGQTVSASTATTVLFTLAHDLGQMQLKVDVDEADIGQVEIGDQAEFSVDAYLGQRFPAQVGTMHYAPTTVDGIVTYPTILTIDNSDKKLRPGMTASADITVEHAEDVMTVPNAAFRYTPPVAQVNTQKTTGLLGMLFSSGVPGSRSRPTVVKNEVGKDGLRSLYVLKDGVPQQVQVKTGLTDGDLTEIMAGPLALGDKVVTAQSSGSR